MQRRLLRHAAGQLGAAPDFAATEALRTLALDGRAGQKLELAQGLRAERTHRELRLAAGAGGGRPAGRSGAAEYEGTVPGEIDAPAFGVRLRMDSAERGGEAVEACEAGDVAQLEAGDRVTLRYSSGPRKVKEVLERMRVTGTAGAFGRCSNWKAGSCGCGMWSCSRSRGLRLSRGFSRLNLRKATPPRRAPRSILAPLIPRIRVTSGCLKFCNSKRHRSTIWFTADPGG